MASCFTNREWRLDSLYWIVDEIGQKVAFSAIKRSAPHRIKSTAWAH